MKTAIVTCSNAGLDYLEHSDEIKIMRSSIHFGSDEVYQDYIEMGNKEFYQRLIDKPNVIPSTSFMTIGRMIEMFEDLKSQGYDEVIAIVISAKMSNLYNAVRNLASQVDIKLHVFDSKTMGYPESYMVLKAYEMSKNGKNADEIIPVLEKIRDNMKTYFTVDTLLYLIKNGRLSKFSGALATMLKIRPVLLIDKEGKVATLEKQRTTKKSLERVLELYKEETQNENDVISYIIHADNPDVVLHVKEEMKRMFPNREIVVSPLTPVVGAHAGPKSVGIGYIIVDK